VSGSEGRRGARHPLPRRLGVAGAGLWIALATSAAAQTGEGQRIEVRLMVSHASSRPGPVDPAAADLHQSLRSDFRYNSLRVIERRRLALGAGESGGLELPNGKRVSVRPIQFGPGGVLLAVDIENTLHTDVRVPDRRPVVIGVDRYDGGKLILSLEPTIPAQ
jgi:hypothetical protein